MVKEWTERAETRAHNLIIDGLTQKKIDMLALIADLRQTRSSRIERKRTLLATEFSAAQAEFKEANEALVQTLECRLSDVRTARSASSRESAHFDAFWSHLSFFAHCRALLKISRFASVQLQGDLEVDTMVRLQEVAEHASLHIRALEENHWRVFGDMKTFYREATRDNLGLIQVLTKDIEQLKARKLSSECLAKKLTGKNRSLRDFHREAATVKVKLGIVVEEQDKTRLFLSNARSRHCAAARNLERARTKHEALEVEFLAITQESALDAKQGAAKQANSDVDQVQQLYLEERLKLAQQGYSAAQTKVLQIAASQGMVGEGGQVSAMEGALEARNRHIEDLEFRLVDLSMVSVN